MRGMLGFSRLNEKKVKTEGVICLEEVSEEHKEQNDCKEAERSNPIA